IGDGPGWFAPEEPRGPPVIQLFDSHILEPQSGALFDAAEGFEAYSHHLRTGLSIIGGPSSKPGNDPCSEGEFFRGHSVAGTDQLHDGDGRHSCCGDVLDHDLGFADVGFLDIKTRGLERAEVLLDSPTLAV